MLCRWMKVDVDVSVDTGKIVGLTVKDRDLQEMEDLIKADKPAGICGMKN